MERTAKEGVVPFDPVETATDESLAFQYENGFYRTASISRFSKFVSHLDLFRLSSGIPGEIVECGVFKGASLFRWIKFRQLLENQSSRRVIGFDVFGEFPEATIEEDRRRRQQFVEAAGSSGPSVSELQTNLRSQNLDENVELIQGNVLETVPAYVSEKQQLKISLLNIDVDLYEPTLCCLENLFPRVVPGGVVILDDYGAFPGANRAIDEYFSEMNVHIEKLPHAHEIAYLVKKKAP